MSNINNVREQINGIKVNLSKRAAAKVSDGLKPQTPTTTESGPGVWITSSERVKPYNVARNGISGELQTVIEIRIGSPNAWPIILKTSQVEKMLANGVALANIVREHKSAHPSGVAGYFKMVNGEAVRCNGNGEVVTASADSIQAS